MQLLICVLFSFTLGVTVAGQLHLPIPCQSDNTCTSIIDPSKEHICYKGICMCQNSTSKFYELCSRKDAILGAKPKGLRRSCDSDADCELIAGATCTSTDGSNATKICDCKSHLVASDDGQSCIAKIKEIGAKCNETVQCAEILDAECATPENQCRCGSDKHYVLKSNRCTLNKAYGEKCTDDEESCYQSVGGEDKNALRCSGGVCKCLSNHNYMDGKCQYSAGSRTVYQVPLLAAMVVVIAKIF